MLTTPLKFRKNLSIVSTWCVLWFCVLFFATSSQVSFHLINDKITHATVFCVILVLFGWRSRNWRQLAAVTAASFLVGCGIELAQAYLPHRTASMADIAANAIGLACGCGIVLLSRSLRLPVLVAVNPATAVQLRRID